MYGTQNNNSYLISKDEEDAEVLKHGTLRDHLQVQHPTHGCNKSISDTLARLKHKILTARIVPEPDPYAFRTTNGDESTPVRGSYRRSEFPNDQNECASPTNPIRLLNGTEHVTLPVNELSVFHEWFVWGVSIDGTTNVSELSVSTSNTLFDS